MKYVVEMDLENFEAWAGGKETLKVLIENGDCESVEDLINEVYEDAEEMPTETTINDFLWFERDFIAEHLGYRDWEAYEYEKWSLQDLEDADEWFCGIDFDMMERISGKRRDDYSDEDGYQDFVDAVEEWWNSRLDQEKVEIYKENE